jgi:hypothetical protein
MKHKDLEFHVGEEGTLSATMFKTFDAACSHAISLACSKGVAVELDVCTYSKAGARAWGGDDAVETYLDDPEASVHERIIIKAESRGRIP